MLINISNHPYDHWSEEQQQQAVTQFGRVVDVPFPAIAPEATTEEVKQLAKQLVKSICEINKEDFTVHIMGELTFVYAAINYFKQQHICCVASTSERNVTMLTNQEKKIYFRFVRFRAYD